MSLDIILYAIIAVLLLVRLWTVFGRRNDEDRQRPNPFVPPTLPEEKEVSRVPENIRSGETSLLLQPFRVAPASLAGGLEQIKSLDPSFDEKQFLQGARQAFTMIVEDFAKNDLMRIGRLLGPPVRSHFEEAIVARHKAGQTMESKIVRIKDVEVAAVRVDGSEASLTVRFVSEQQNTLRDSSGAIVGGEGGKIEEITDTWVFARDTKSNDPNWFLVETHA